MTYQNKPKTVTSIIKNLPSKSEKFGLNLCNNV